MKKLMGLITVAIMAGVMVAQAEDANQPKEVELKGQIGCSACNYQVAEKCGVSFKTADGKIYTVVKPSEALMKARHEGGTLKVTGTVAEQDGKLFVTASKAEFEK